MADARTTARRLRTEHLIFLMVVRAAGTWINQEFVRTSPYLSVNTAGRLDGIVLTTMVKFLVWCILFVLCWPLALLALVLYPVVWILLIPFRIVGVAVDGALGLVGGIVMFPARLLRGPRAL
jgi:hypothetical protein